MLKTCFVINTMDHKSLVLGMLSYLNMTASINSHVDAAENDMIAICDIRDPLKEAEDYVLFMEQSKSIIDYYGGRLPEISMFLYDVGVVTSWIEKHGVSPGTSLTRWNNCMDNFLNLAKELEDEELVSYYYLLMDLFLLFNGELSPSGLLDRSNTCSESTIKRFKAYCRENNTMLSDKVFTYRVGHTWFSQIQMVDQRVFRIMRLISLSRRKWMHISMGSYGPIVMTSKKVGLDGIPEIGKNCLLLN